MKSIAMNDQPRLAVSADRRPSCWLRRGSAAAIIAVAVLMWSVPAMGSPWTLPGDELTLMMDQNFDYASSEYLPDGHHQFFPLQGRYRAQTMRLGARYGFTDRFEGAIGIDISNVNYQADALVLDEFDETPTPGEATESILDFSSSEFGAGDLRLSGRYNLISGDIMVTTSTTAKVPTGYTSPTGTFTTTEDGTEQTGGQATLGDGQADVTQALLIGSVLPTRTFLRAEAGARYRFGAPGHQAVGNLRVGQPIGSSLIAMAGVSGHLTVVEGDVIGTTFIAEDPTVAAADYTADNIRQQDLRLDRDAVDLSAGLLVDLGDIELTANYQYTVWGRNTGAVHSLTVGSIFALPDVTGR